MLSLVVGIIVGGAIMLQIRGWTSVFTLAGGSCGTDKAVNYGPCPAGVNGILGVSAAIGLAALIGSLAILMKKKWARSILIAVGVPVGLLAGQWLFGIIHGSDLPVAWAAADDGSARLGTVAAWAGGGSLIRIRVDEAVSYDAATGVKQWTLPMPGIDVACGASGPSSSDGIALVGYGGDSSACPYVEAVDLATGRPLWTESVQDPASGNQPDGRLAVADGTAMALTADGITGLSASSGAPRWTLAEPGGCAYQQLAAASGSVVALALCETGYQLTGIDAAVGTVTWCYQQSELSTSYRVQILSADPVVVSDVVGGPEPTATARVFGPDGAQTSHFSIAGIPLNGGTVALDTTPNGGFTAPVVVTDGLLVGATSPNSGTDAIVCYRLADGARQWLTDTPDEVSEVALSGGELDLVDESQPAYSLERIDVATGALRSLGFLSHDIVQPGRSGLYAFAAYDVVVNTTGDSGDQPPVAAIKVPVGRG